MTQKKNIWHKENLGREIDRELVESELALVGGGAGGSQHFPALPDLLTSPDKPSTPVASKNPMFGDLPGFDSLSNLTGSLLGSLVQQP